MNPQTFARTLGIGLLIFCVVIMASSGTYVVNPGFRGVEVILGKVSSTFKPEGFGIKIPIVTVIYPMSVRQQTAEEQADCYSSDLQQIRVNLRVLYRIPEASVVTLFQDYYGQPFASLIAPRVHEALKEVTALLSAEQIVKKREQIKAQSLSIAQKKIGSLLVIEDIVIEDITLSKELGHAIEAKMVQEQEASKSKFFQNRAQIEADTAVIQAKGEAQSIVIRGKALKENPAFVDLKIVDKWDGFTPVVIGGGENLLLSLQDAERLRGSRPILSTNQSAANPRRSPR
ncbi:MAG: prohibitin family protein [Pedosphaera sp.]|nr:prohibitin family protein [Pedosphaera sp.]